MAKIGIGVLLGLLAVLTFLVAACSSAPAQPAATATPSSIYAEPEAIAVVKDYLRKEGTWGRSYAESDWNATFYPRSGAWRVTMTYNPYPTKTRLYAWLFYEKSKVVDPQQVR